MKALYSKSSHTNFYEIKMQNNAIYDEIIKDVIDLNTNHTHTVFPFPTAGNHTAIHQLINDYAVHDEKINKDGLAVKSELEQLQNNYTFPSINN